MAENVMRVALRIPNKSALNSIFGTRYIDSRDIFSGWFNNIITKTFLKRLDTIGIFRNSIIDDYKSLIKDLKAHSRPYLGRYSQIDTLKAMKKAALTGIPVRIETHKKCRLRNKAKSLGRSLVTYENYEGHPFDFSRDVFLELYDGLRGRSVFTVLG